MLHHPQVFCRLPLFPLPSLFLFPTYHTELSSTDVMTVAATATWAEEMWASLSWPGICYTQGHSLLALSVATLQNFPTPEALLGSRKVRFHSLRASPLHPVMVPAPSLPKRLLLPHHHS